jgi:hypothetical protein
MRSVLDRNLIKGGIFAMTVGKNYQAFGNICLPAFFRITSQGSIPAFSAGLFFPPNMQD